MRRSVAALLMLLALVAPANAADDPIVPAPSVRETTPVESTGDAMDDPAVWVHPTDPSRSLVIGNNKQGALETYDLEGNRVQQLSDAVTFWGNVDVRQGVPVAGVVGDIVAVYHRGLQLYRVDPSTRLLTRVNEETAIPTPGEGLCLYSSPETGRLYAFVIAISGTLRQFEIRDDDQDGLLEGVEVRQFAVGSEAEGCVADDERGALYVSEEEVGLWRYGAEPEARHGSDVRGHDRARTATWHWTSRASPSSPFPTAAGTSSHRRRTPRTRTTRSSSSTTGSPTPICARFRVTAGGSSDDCDRTDGITAHADRPRPAVHAGDLRLPGQQQRRAGNGRQPEPQVRAAGERGRSRWRNPVRGHRIGEHERGELEQHRLVTFGPGRGRAR